MAINVGTFWFGLQTRVSNNCSCWQVSVMVESGFLNANFGSLAMLRMRSVMAKSDTVSASHSKIAKHFSGVRSGIGVHGTKGFGWKSPWILLATANHLGRAVGALSARLTVLWKQNWKPAHKRIRSKIRLWGCFAKLWTCSNNNTWGLQNFAQINARIKRKPLSVKKPCVVEAPENGWQGLLIDMTSGFQ